MRCDPPPSSPQLKARKQGLSRRRGGDSWRLIPACSLALGLFLYFRMPSTGSDLSLAPSNSLSGNFNIQQDSKPAVSHRPGVPLAGRPHHSIATHTSDLPDPLSFDSIPDRSLTVILPVDSASLPDLERAIIALLEYPGAVREIAISCPDAIFADTRQIVRKTISAGVARHHMEMSLHPRANGEDVVSTLLHLASEATTDWILFLGEEGLKHAGTPVPSPLTNPLSYPLPIGPRGALSHHSTTSCIKASAKAQAASFLVPPFVSPAALLRDHVIASKAWSWADFGAQVSRERLDGVGGVVTGTYPSSWCSLTQTPALQGYPFADMSLAAGLFQDANSSKTMDVLGEHFLQDIATGTFAIILPSLEDVGSLSSMICRLQSDGHDVHILLYESADLQRGSPSSSTLNGRCRLDYDTLSSDDHISSRPDTLLVHDWLMTFGGSPNIVIALRESFLVNSPLHFDGAEPSLMILLPRADLPYCEWMGSLSVEEWKSWNMPTVDISVITNDRPHSLERLLSSLSSAKFFGDTPLLRINLEQSSDVDTIKLVQEYRWNHGTTVVNHRVIHGGLLPAVVESWYPHTDHSYGLLLEDDVELSPMFYAWVKMSILRYRYGKVGNKSPLLFGISLYQQKNIELRSEGRRPFDAKAIFFDHGIPHSHTPYLSQIPCSWGAVYFPEHWKEFHEYLAVRLSEHSFTINEDVVPDIRSNRWSKSWKKYFIELVHLRGYTMLYPNYADFISLSTNHLEVGAHVKGLPVDVYLHRKEMFLLPLMPLPLINETGPRILDLPGQTLPAWEKLPVLNLTGAVTSSDALVKQGHARRAALTNCLFPTSVPHDIRDLLCIQSIDNHLL